MDSLQLGNRDSFFQPMVKQTVEEQQLKVLITEPVLTGQMFHSHVTACANKSNDCA